MILLICLTTALIAFNLFVQLKKPVKEGNWLYGATIISSLIWVNFLVIFFVVTYWMQAEAVNPVQIPAVMR